MERVINGFGNGAYPLDVDALRAMQTNGDMLAMLGAVCGESGAIIAGGEVTGGNHVAGYVWLRSDDFPDGEILSFPAGANTAVYKVKKTGQSVVRAGVTYSNVHTTRVLATDGEGTTYGFTSFYVIDDRSLGVIKMAQDALMARVEAIVPNPIGSIVMWTSLNIPTGYMECNGGELCKTEYVDLYAVLGDMYGVNGNNFKLPDMQGLFVCGYRANNTSYGTINQKGGWEQVVLTIDEMPAHNHNYERVEGSGDGGIQSGADRLRQAWGATYTGGGKAHENRPPYIVLKYIIRVR